MNFSWAENVLSCTTLSLHITMQVQKLELDVAYMRQLLEYWVGVPCTTSREPLSSLRSLLLGLDSLNGLRGGQGTVPARP
jgi:hypothetical protein